MKNSSEEFRVVDQYELEKENDSKTVYSTFVPKAIAGIIAFICLLLDILKIVDPAPARFITKHIDWILVNVPIVIFILMLIILRSCKTDTWVIELARNEIGSTFMKVTTRRIILNFDVKSTKKDINKLVQDLTDRSELYNYFLEKVDYTNARIRIKTRKKTKIPEKANFDRNVDNDEKWNYIPLGIALTDKSTLGTVNWMLNDEEKPDIDYRPTLPSVSFLVAGTTGSGKTVVETNIIRHINKFSDKIQSCLVDVKRVEFGNLSNLEGINAVATDIKEAKFVLEATQAVMYNRFKFMEGEDKNNIYKIKNYKCDYFVFDSGDKSFQCQFDEILFCNINGENIIDTADNIYQKIKNGDEVLIYFDGQKTAPVVINPSTEYVFLGQDLYKLDDMVKTRKGEFTAKEIFNMVQNGETVVI